MKRFPDVFATGGFPLQGSCLAAADAVWPSAAADALIAIAYYSIVVALVYLRLRRRDLALRRIFWLAGAFFFACGTAQLVQLATRWQPLYGLDASIKVVTALIAVFVAIALWRFLPQAMALPGRRELELSNQQLEQQVATHRAIEEKLRASEERFHKLSEALERRIADRASEFEAANLLLQWEIEDRQRAEAKLHRANAVLKETLTAQEQHAAALAQLNQMAGLMQTCRTEAEVYDVVARFGPHLFRARGGAVYTLNRSGSVAKAVAVWGDVPPDEQIFNAVDCCALHRAKLYPDDAAQADAGCPHLRSDSGRRHICAPLTASGELLGILHLRGRPVPMYGQERALLAMASEHIALAAADLKLRANLTQQTVRDALTSLFNRRYLEEYLALEERRGLRAGWSIGIVLLDLDRFKEINDVHGHQAGDEVLRRVAAVLQEQTRAGDVPCRYGGEEFLLILPGASLEVTRQRAEQIRAMIELQQIAFRGRPIGAVTASLGVAAFPESGTSVGDAVAAADRALYLAKKKGRNRVECEDYREVA